MAHPLKGDSSDSHNAKLRRMTRHYGSASGPANNIKSPQEYMKGEGPEDNVGFGADIEMARARGDRPARKAASTNPLATYKKGGRVCAPAGKPAEVATRARGGRLHGKGKGSTHVNVIVAPHSGAQTPPVGASPSPALAALAGGSRPPVPAPAALPPVGGPPPGGGMMPPGGAPPMPMRAKGGKVGHPDEAADKALINKMLKEKGLTKAKGGGVNEDMIAHSMKEQGLHRRARGGATKHHMTAGADSGVGRLEKIGIKAKDAGEPQEV